MTCVLAAIPILELAIEADGSFTPRTGLFWAQKRGR
jgi:hypothetical protein